MDDRHFSDPKVAREWIRIAESDRAKVREAELFPRLRAWADGAGEKILEIGCGQGACSDRIDLEKRSYVGMDPSPLLVARANELYADEQRRFVPGNVYQLPFADAEFDAVFSVAVWHLLANPRGAAAELARVLSAGGRFFIVTANPATYAEWTKDYANPRREGTRFEGEITYEDGTKGTDVLHLHTRDTLESTLGEAGLVVTKAGSFRRAESGVDLYLTLEGSKPIRRKTLSVV